MQQPIKLIVGLGNPGDQYAKTRHNVGFWFVDGLARKFGLRFQKEHKFHSQLCLYRSEAHQCRLCKPLTYMNHSGRALQSLLQYYRLAVSEVLIVHDDIDLQPGQVRFKNNGGHGGNNGVRDILRTVGMKDFMRLRIGVGHPGNRDAVVGYVLHPPRREEYELIELKMQQIVESYAYIFSGGFSRLMNMYN